MRIGLDTSVLICAHLAGLERHETAREYLTEYLGRPDITFVVTALVLHEWVHVVTDARRFDPPVTMAEAVEIASGYLHRTNVECLPVDEESFLLACRFLTRYRLGRKRIADSLLAATLLSHGVSWLTTFDVKDFSVYSDLKIIEPRLPR